MKKHSSMSAALMMAALSPSYVERSCIPIMQPGQMKRYRGGATKQVITNAERKRKRKLQKQARRNHR